ncbi:hypothetical protein HMSSN139_51590 [Paenibacillus sp. HMSSN-139]|nr:hypothetical protein HMSSN139_51590 [Paenibacillus sp. HMSSN-139]
MLATVLPSAAGLILLLRLLAKYRQSNVVKGMTLLVQPVIAIMMVTLTWQVAKEPLTAIGIWQTMAIAAIAFWAMERRKIHPALIIVAAFIYGGVVLQHYV